MVSRCILEEVRAGRGIEGKDYVHLDLTHLGEDVIYTKLAEITGFARTYAGVDAAREAIPVQPNCHYMMGGIATDAETLRPQIILSLSHCHFLRLSRNGVWGCKSLWWCTDVCPKGIPITKCLGQIKRVIKKKEKAAG
jgi:hypothetical protein